MKAISRLATFSVLALALLSSGCAGGGGDTQDTSAPVTAASPAGGTFSQAQSVTLTCSDGNGSGCLATFYTTDGSAPHQRSSVYSSPIPIAESALLKFFSVDNVGNEESPRTESYTITSVTDTTPPTTSASPAGGTYDSAQNVTLSCDDGSGSGCNNTFYTLDGSVPDTNSASYSTPIDIHADTTLKFFSVDNAGNEESPRTESYTITSVTDTTPPITSASPLGGSYTDEQEVSLTCDDGAGSGCDVTYYTVDGSDPTNSSSVYASPIHIATDTTLKFFSSDLAGNEEAVKTEAYQFVAQCQPGVDTDGDGMEDCDELAGWNIDL